jgi:hypothetical protein
MPGQFGSKRRRKIKAAEPTLTAIAAGLRVGNAWASTASFGQQRPGVGGRQIQAAQIPELAGKDRHRDPAGEADGHGMRDVSDERTEPQQAYPGQHEAGKEDRQQQSVEAELGRCSCDENDERACRTADLIAAASERRYQKAANDGGI